MISKVWLLRLNKQFIYNLDRSRMMEQSISLQEFHDLGDVDNEGDEDVEAGCHQQNYHFSLSLIWKRGFKTLHQVGY